jgi:hypothetical protein
MTKREPERITIRKYAQAHRVTPQAVRANLRKMVTPDPDRDAVELGGPVMLIWSDAYFVRMRKKSKKQG